MELLEEATSAQIFAETRSGPTNPDRIARIRVTPLRYACCMIEHQFEYIRREVAVVVDGLDLAAVTPPAAARLVQSLTAIEHMVAGARVVLLARAAQDEQWRHAGETSAVDHLARQAGTTPNAVKDAIKASEQLEGLAATRAALAGGRLSPQQATAIAAAASAEPAAEPALLRAADRESLAGLRQECARVVAAATDQVERERAQHRNRSFRTWTDEVGSLCGRFSLPAVTGAELLAIFQPFRDRAFAAARHAGHRDSYDNYAADGLMAMARAAGSSPPGSAAGPKARIQVRCDYFALTRGQVAPGEVAEIPGVGPVSIPAIREMFDDAIVDVLVTKGRDVTTIATNTRYIPQPLRIALAEREQMCFVAGCNRRLRLEHDHQELFSETHETSFANLHRACARHHALKTRHGYQFVDTPAGWQCVPGNGKRGEPSADP